MYIVHIYMHVYVESEKKCAQINSPECSVDTDGNSWSLNLFPTLLLLWRWKTTSGLMTNFSNLNLLQKIHARGEIKKQPGKWEAQTNAKNCI